MKPPDRPATVLAIMGPTAAGKTDLAVAIARQVPVDIISVDSALVYRGMDIGTAKPSPDVLAEFPHRLLDIRDPAEAYSAANFRNDALREIEASIGAGRIPLLVGGTMLYFRALFSGLSALPSADPDVRARLDADAAALGWTAMHARLTAVDPAAGQKIHRNDPQRIQRALEVYEITGVPWSELCAVPPPSAFPFRLSSVIVAPTDRAVLHERIARRFEAMLAQGFIEEVEKLRVRGDLHLGLPALRAVGYRQAWQYLDGHCDFTTMCYRAVAATRQLAKRQLTWLRRDWGAQWFDGDGEELAQRVLKFFVANIK